LCCESKGAPAGTKASIFFDGHLVASFDMEVLEVETEIFPSDPPLYEKAKKTILDKKAFDDFRASILERKRWAKWEEERRIIKADRSHIADKSVSSRRRKQKPT
jgi:hypothetical protein